MKTRFLNSALCFVAALSLTFTSCQTNSLRQLEEVLEEMNQECPIEMEVSTIHSVRLDGRMAEFKTTFDGAVFDFAMLSSHQDLFKRVMTLNMASSLLSLEDGKETIRLMKREGVGFRFICCEDRGTGRICIEVSSTELDRAVSAAENPVELARQSLTNESEFSQLALPLEVDENTILTGCSYSGNEVVYTYDLVGIDELMEDRETRDYIRKYMEEATREEIRNVADNPQIGAAFYKRLVIAGASLRYAYKSTNGYSFSYTISNSELAELFD